MSAWPSKVCTTRRSAPLCSKWLANAWRRTWGLTCSGNRPAATASSFNSRAACCLVKCPPSDDANNHFDWDAGSRSWFQRASAALYSRIADFAASLSGTSRSLPPLPRTISISSSRRAADAGNVISSETREPCRLLRIDGLPCRRNQAVDLRDREHFRQRSTALGSFDNRCRIIVAVSLCEEEAV